ncbi:hypothetical protein, partial [Streptococcus dysgalactiae]
YFVQMRWFKHGNSHFDLKTLKKTNTKSMFVFNLNHLYKTDGSQASELFPLFFSKRPIYLKSFKILDSIFSNITKST